MSNFYFGCHGNGPNCVGAVWGRFGSGSEALNTYIGIINVCAKFHACTLNSTKTIKFVTNLSEASMTEVYMVNSKV